MRKLIVFAALVAGVACSLNTDVPTGPLVGRLDGTYGLQTVNGSSLPFTIVGHDTTLLIDKDVLVVDASGTWSENVNYRQTVGVAAATVDSFQLAGIWSRSGNSLNFRTQDLRLLYVGVATDTTLQLTDSQYEYLFKR
jgi:hypothetical protein